MNEIAKQPEKKLPTLVEIFEKDLELAANAESLNAILNAPPPASFVKAHPIVKSKDDKGNDVPYWYIPIDRVEYLLRKIFKKFRIEITGQGTAFNGVWVTVRVHYFDPSISDWNYQDGIGSAQLQTAKGTSPADLNNIKSGAISMAFPIAKTEAVKDACHLIGKIFGADLNRRDALQFQPDTEIIDRYKKSLEDNHENITQNEIK